MKIPFLDLISEYKNIKTEIDNAIHKVLDSGHYILGPDVKALEEEIAAYTEVKYAIGVASGTDALQLSLMALDLPKDAEIIVPSFTFIATVEVIILLGFKPVFVDVIEKTGNLNPALIEAAINEKTKAIIPVHLYGQCADMDKIKEIAKHYKLAIIEDSAQALGSRYKERSSCSSGDLACLSFYPTKNLGAFGEAGMILTNNEELAKKLYIIRAHGSAKKYQHTIIGVNSRLDTIQAAILRVKLKYLEEWNTLRREKAEVYNQLFKKAKTPVHLPYIAEGNEHIFHQYTLRVDKRDELQSYLQENSIPTGVHYPLPLHLQPVFENLGYHIGDFPISETLSNEVISLPMYPKIPLEHQKIIVNTINEFYKK